MRRWAGWLVVALLTAGVSEAVLRVALGRVQLRNSLMRLGGHALRVANLEAAARQNMGAIVGVPFDHDPALGWVMRPSYEREDPHPVRTNAQGMRGGTDRPPGEGGRPVVALLGDSFAFGSDVSDQETFFAQMAEALPEAEFLNFGVVGYGHDQMLLRYRRDVRPYRADVVVLPLLDCDYYRNETEFTVWFKPRFVLDGGQLVLEQQVPVSLEAAVTRHRWGSRLVDTLQILGEAAAGTASDPASQRTSDGYRLAESILDTLAAEAAADGATTLLFYAPLPAETRESLDALRASPNHAAYLSICEGWDHCVDATEPVLQAVADGVPPTPPRRAHWSAGLNAVLAETLVPVTREILAQGAQIEE